MGCCGLVIPPCAFLMFLRLTHPLAPIQIPSFFSWNRASSSSVPCPRRLYCCPADRPRQRWNVPLVLFHSVHPYIYPITLSYIVSSTSAEHFPCASTICTLSQTYMIFVWTRRGRCGWVIFFFLSLRYNIHLPLIHPFRSIRTTFHGQFGLIYAWFYLICLVLFFHFTTVELLVRYFVLHSFSNHLANEWALSFRNTFPPNAIGGTSDRNFWPGRVCLREVYTVQILWGSSYLLLSPSSWTLLKDSLLAPLDTRPSIWKYCVLSKNQPDIYFAVGINTFHEYWPARDKSSIYHHY